MADDFDDVILTELEEAFRRSQASMQEVFTRGFDRLEASLLTIMQWIDTMVRVKDGLSEFSRSTSSVEQEIDPGTQACLLFTVEENETEELSGSNLNISNPNPELEADVTEAVELLTSDAHDSSRTTTVMLLPSINVPDASKSIGNFLYPKLTKLSCNPQLDNPVNKFFQGFMVLDNRADDCLKDDSLHDTLGLVPSIIKPEVLAPLLPLLLCSIKDYTLLHGFIFDPGMIFDPGIVYYNLMAGSQFYEFSNLLQHGYGLSWYCGGGYILDLSLWVANVILLRLGFDTGHVKRVSCLNLVVEIYSLPFIQTCCGISPVFSNIVVDPGDVRTNESLGYVGAIIISVNLVSVLLRGVVVVLSLCWVSCIIDPAALWVEIPDSYLDVPTLLVFFLANCDRGNDKGHGCFKFIQSSLFSAKGFAQALHIPCPWKRYYTAAELPLHSFMVKISRTSSQVSSADCSRDSSDVPKYFLSLIIVIVVPEQVKSDYYLYLLAEIYLSVQVGYCIGTVFSHLTFGPEDGTSCGCLKLVEVSDVSFARFPSLMMTSYEWYCITAQTCENCSCIMLESVITNGFLYVAFSPLVASSLYTIWVTWVPYIDSGKHFLSFIALLVVQSCWFLAVFVDVNFHDVGVLLWFSLWILNTYGFLNCGVCLIGILSQLMYTTSCQVQTLVLSCSHVLSRRKGEFPCPGIKLNAAAIFLQPWHNNFAPPKCMFFLLILRPVRTYTGFLVAVIQQELFTHGFAIALQVNNYDKELVSLTEGDYCMPQRIIFASTVESSPLCFYGKGPTYRKYTITVLYLDKVGEDKTDKITCAKHQYCLCTQQADHGIISVVTPLIHWILYMNLLVHLRLVCWNGLDPPTCIPWAALQVNFSNLDLEGKVHFNGGGNVMFIKYWATIEPKYQPKTRATVRSLKGRAEGRRKQEMIWLFSSLRQTLSLSMLSSPFL